jgi:hypothetical protein
VPRRGLIATAYSSLDRREWDEFVGTAKNATFLFQRDYMEYHRDRFVDASVVVRSDGRLDAVMPAVVHDQRTVVSHAGLTYGGLVLRRDASLFDVMAAFRSVLEHLANRGISTLVYRRIPSFYSALPDSEVEFLAYLVGASTRAVDATAVVSQLDRLDTDTRRRRGVRKAAAAGADVREGRFEEFWEDVLEPRLAERYEAKPVHTRDEMVSLANQFPGNIRQFTVHADGAVVAGVTVYETALVAKAQYIASTEAGRRIGALDFLLQWLLNDRYANKRFVDLGTSNHPDGTVNRPLLEWKEGFGARAHTFATYAFDTDAYRKLSI